MQPKPESRISNLENRTTTLEAMLLEMSSDTAEELKVIRQEIKQGHIDIGKSLDSHAESLMQEIRKQATKEDLAGLIVAQDVRFDKVEGDIAELKGDITSIKTTQEQILKLLQQK
jgi:hypothetical protein